MYPDSTELTPSISSYTASRHQKQTPPSVAVSISPLEQCAAPTAPGTAIAAPVECFWDRSPRPPAQTATRAPAGTSREDRQLQLRHAPVLRRHRSLRRRKTGSIQFPRYPENHGARSGVLKLAFHMDRKSAV